VWASVADQVYRGARGEYPVCDEAITATAGQILIHAGQPIMAYYCSTCGGVTSQIEEVWPRTPELYLVSHSDAPAGGGESFCAAAKYYRWRETWSGRELATILARTLPAYVDYMANPERAGWAGPLFSPHEAGNTPRRPGQIRNLEIARLTRSGRVARLDIDTVAGVYHVRGDRVRWVLEPASGSPSILRSARFELTVTETDGRIERVTAHGHGYGHGVGMCQTGALEMARRGYGAAAILSHYYPGATLVSYVADTK
jgi:stage II sporulation protein D